MAAKKVQLELQTPDGNKTMVLLVAESKAKAKSILMRRWRSRYPAQDGDEALGEDDLRAKQDKWIAETFGEWV